MNKDAQMRATINQKLIETGERERLKDLLRAKLIECGWKDQLKAHCKELLFNFAGGYRNILLEILRSNCKPPPPPWAAHSSASFREVVFPNVQPEPPPLQLEAIPSSPITSCTREESNPQLTTTSLQMSLKKKD
uniref:ENY2, transcription and export complex 2 subunit n=1 Tax=Gallus gallus TaxID=9031 RepID=A0A8V0XZW3_CHICK